MKRQLTIAAVAVGLTAAVAGGHVDAQEPPPPPAATNSCTSYDLLLLMDRSLSLRTTDSEFARISAAEDFLDGVSQAASDDFPINVSIAGFGTAVDPSEPFALPEQHDMAYAKLESFRAPPSDRNTDYVLALQATLDHFDGLDDSSCKKLVWFTDGAYDIEDVEATRSYTTLPTAEEIIDDFGHQVCDAGADSRSARIRAANVEVVLVDLRTDNDTSRQQLLRAKSDPVLDRFFNPDDPCGVVGRRIPVADAAALDDAFQEEAQRILEQARADFAAEQLAAGREPIDCKVLEAGVPINLVKSVAAYGDTMSTPINITTPNGDVAGPTHDFTDTERDVSGSLFVHAGSGTLQGCYLANAGGVRLVDPPHIWRDAATTHVFVTVGGTGSQDQQLTSLGNDAVAVTWQAGAAASEPATWNADLQRWEFDIPQTAVNDADSVALSVQVSVPSLGASLPPLKESLQVDDEPPAPNVAWVGPTTYEGSGQIDGKFHVTPTATVGGEVCVAFDQPADLRNADATVLGTLDVGASTPACGSDDAPFDVPATLTVEHAANAVGTANVAYDSHYSTPDGMDHVASGDAELTVQLTKPADTGKMVWTAIALAVASGLISAIALWLLTRRQSRLPSPDDFVAVTVPLSSSEDGSMATADANGIQMLDMRRIDGSRRQFRLSPATTIRRRTTLNPFASIAAEVVTDRGVVRAVPSLGTNGARRQQVPSRFKNLFVMHSENGIAEAYLIVPHSTTPSCADALAADSLARLNRAAGAGRRPDGNGSNGSASVGTSPTANEGKAVDDAAVQQSAPARTPPPPPPRRRH